jgi:hypothetical protein
MRTGAESGHELPDSHAIQDVQVGDAQLLRSREIVSAQNQDFKQTGQSQQ